MIEAATIAAMKTVKEIRLENARALATDGPAEFARAIDSTTQQVNQFMGPNPTRNIGNTIARRIEEAFGKPVGWLDVEHAEQISAPDDVSKKSHQPTGSSGSAYNVPLEGDNFVMGPDLRPKLYPEISWVQAGMWTELCENFVADESTAWHQCHIDLGPCGFVVKVRGPSMTAPAGSQYSFPDGINLFVSPTTEVAPGKYVIVRRDDKATFKKLSLVDGELYLEALNPDWPDRYMKLRADDQFLGVVRHAGFDVLS